MESLERFRPRAAPEGEPSARRRYLFPQPPRIQDQQHVDLGRLSWEECRHLDIRRRVLDEGADDLPLRGIRRVVDEAEAGHERSGLVRRRLAPTPRMVPSSVPHCLPLSKTRAQMERAESAAACVSPLRYRRPAQRTRWPPSRRMAA